MESHVSETAKRGPPVHFNISFDRGLLAWQDLQVEGETDRAEAIVSLLILVRVILLPILPAFLLFNYRTLYRCRHDCIALTLDCPESAH